MKIIYTISAFVWLFLLSFSVHAQTQYRAMACMSSTGDSNTPTYWFSKEFLSYPEQLPGESENDRIQRTNNLERRAVTEFVEYLHRNGAQYAHASTTDCGGYLASTWRDKEYVLRDVRDRMKSTVSTNTNQYTKITPQYTDFVPSWAAKQTGTYSQETERHNGIVVKSVSSAPLKPAPAPTPVKLPVDRAAERTKLEQKMQQYMTKKSTEVQKRAEALRADYDRRMRACAAGDRPNCYFIVSAQ